MGKSFMKQQIGPDAVYMNIFVYVLYNVNDFVKC